MRSRNANAGFSLIEILVVIAILGVVTTLSATALISITDEWKVVQKRASLNGQADSIFRDYMRRDFHQVLSSALSGVPLVGIEDDYQNDSQFWKMVLEDDKIILPLEDTSPFAPADSQHSVMYHIDRSGALPNLRRTMGGLGANPPEGSSTVIAEGVIGMRIAYFDGENWQGAWEQEALPEAVRVSLSMVDTDRIHEQVARMATFTIYVD